MKTTQYIPTTDSNGTSNLNHLLSERQLQVIRLMQPKDLAKVFGPGEDVDIPEKGYTDPEWYFQSSTGCVWGIGWRWGQARLRGSGFSDLATSTAAAEFVAFLNREVSNA